MEQATYWWAMGSAALVVLLSGLIEWKRSHRYNLDHVSWVPWTAIQVFGWFALAIFFILALKS
jgi:hypothetical protein